MKRNSILCICLAGLFIVSCTGQSDKKVEPVTTKQKQEVSEEEKHSMKAKASQGGGDKKEKQASKKNSDQYTGGYFTEITSAQFDDAKNRFYKEAYKEIADYSTSTGQILELWTAEPFMVWQDVSIAGVYTAMFEVFEQGGYEENKDEYSSFYSEGNGEIFNFNPELSFGANTLAKFAGLEWGMKQGKHFKHVNPAVVKWMRNHMIPAPGQVIHGNKTALEIYNSSFRDYLRVFYEMHRFLDTRDITYHGNEYVKALEQAKSEGRYFSVNHYIKERYAGSQAYTDLVESNVYMYPESYTGRTFNPDVAISFWLRRGYDGSSGELYKTLEYILSNYDAEYYEFINTPIVETTEDWEENM